MCPRRRMSLCVWRCRRAPLARSVRRRAGGAQQPMAKTKISGGAGGRRATRSGRRSWLTWRRRRASGPRARAGPLVVRAPRPRPAASPARQDARAPLPLATDGPRAPPPNLRARQHNQILRQIYARAAPQTSVMMSLPGYATRARLLHLHTNEPIKMRARAATLAPLLPGARARPTISGTRAT